VKFYTEVLGFYTIMEPTDVVEDDTPVGVMCTDVFGAGWGHLRIAHLSTGDRVGIELFELDGNHPPARAFDPQAHGCFHFAVQDPDVEGLLARIIEAGGKQRMPIRHYYPGQKPYRMVYVEDPFGIVFELCSHSYELIYSSGAYA
jgi:lactoylglutathione lyase family protein